MTLGAALLGLGFLIAAQLASEGPRVRYTTQERTPLLETAIDLQAQQDELKERLLELRAQIGELEAAGPGSAALVRELNDELEQARIAAGLIPLTGTGIVLQLEDSAQAVPGGASEDDYLVNAHDLRAVDRGAVARRGRGDRGQRRADHRRPRRSSTSATSVLVNSAYLAPPYQVTAIGPDDLYDRLASAPGFIDFVRARAEAYGIRVSFAEPATVDVPAFAGTVSLRYSRPVAAPSPTPAAGPASSPPG